MGKKILVVEDDNISANVLKDYFTAQGFDTSIASDGVEAVQKFEEEKPDLMIIDVLIPKKNGLEVCHEVRGKPGGHDIPIIIISAVYKGPHAEEHVKANVNAQDYMVKPFKLRELFEKVKSIIGSQQ